MTETFPFLSHFSLLLENTEDAKTWDSFCQSAGISSCTVLTHWTKSWPWVHKIQTPPQLQCWVKHVLLCEEFMKSVDLDIWYLIFKLITQSSFLFIQLCSCWCVSESEQYASRLQLNSYMWLGLMQITIVVVQPSAPSLRVHMVWDHSAGVCFHFQLLLFSLVWQWHSSKSFQDENEEGEDERGLPVEWK